jgi:predicted membrane protein
MQDIILGFLLLVLATLLFMAVMLELATWLMILLGAGFLITMLIWIVLVGEKRRKRKRRHIE